MARLAAYSVATKALICWSFLWRGIAIGIGSALCGGLLGGIAGAVLGLTGLFKAAPFVGGLLGALCGFVFLYFYVRWLLTSRLGQFRLLLVHAEE